MRLALLALVALTLSAHAAPPVQLDYMLNCQGCHLPDGSGFPGRGVPDVRPSLGKLLLVEGGREYLVQVPGTSQSSLDDEQLSAVLNWMIEMFSDTGLPEGVEPYTPEEVGHLRRTPLIKVTATRNRLLATESGSHHE